MPWENPGPRTSVGNARGNLSESANLDRRTAYLDWVGWMAGEATFGLPGDVYSALFARLRGSQL